MSTTASAPGGATRTLDVPGGRIAYDDTGRGPLAVLVPGMGDVRATYRFLVPRLVDAGYRVVTMDLRGHGESSTGWTDYRDTAIASDVLALVRHLAAGPAVLVGNSYGGAAVVSAAATEPGAARALVLLDAFVRDLPQSAMQRLAVRALALLGVGAWTAYYKSLYKATPPADLAAYVGALKATLKEPGRYAATVAMLPTAQGSHAAVEARLGAVRAPALVVMGSRDPDFPDPAAEAARTARALGAAPRVEVEVIEGAGHYPHAEQPERVTAAMVAFLASAGVPGIPTRHGA